MLEQIPECIECRTQLRNVRRLASSHIIDSQALAPHLSAARVAARQCYEACASALSKGKEVVDTAAHPTISLGWTGVQNLLQNWQRELDGYERIAQNLPFSHWAGGSLRDHDNEPSISEIFDEQLNFIHDRHAKRDHIGIEYKDLEYSRWHKQLRVNSTFHNYDIAERTIGRVLAYYWDNVIAWLSSTESDEPNWWKRNGLVLPVFETGADIGYAIKQGRAKRHITTKLKVVLVRDPKAPKGFWIKDAYPVP